MKQHHIINMLRVTAIALLMMTGMSAMAQTERQTTSADSIDIMMARIDSLTRTDSVVTLEEDPVQSVLIDSTRIAKPKRDWNTWRPNPKRALWLAYGIARCRTDIQSQVLETSYHLWRVHRVYLCPHME